MLSVKGILFVVLGCFAAVYLTVWLLAILRARQSQRITPTPLQAGIGFVTNFFDTLGIGSFATTTSLYKLRGLVPDRVIPGTLNVGHALPTFAQALIYISIVEVDLKTLILMITASVIGSWLGAGIVAGWSRRKVQIGMGVSLLAAALIMLITQLKLVPPGGDTLELGGVRMAIGVTGNFVLGALMTLGIGLYAPCLILISLLGMAPTTAFPIMMGSCAFLMPAASLRFIRRDSYSVQNALGLAIGGVPGVLIAAFIVRSLPLAAVRWLVVVVVVYTAITMLRSAFVEKRAEASPELASPAIPGPTELR